MSSPAGWVSAAALVAAILPGPTRGSPGYESDVERWRSDREARLRSEDGWLTVIGLFWLKEGVNRFGRGSDNDIVLPGDEGPLHAGVFEFHGKRVKVVAEPAAGLSRNGQSVSSLELTPDTAGGKDLLALGALRLVLIERGGRYGIRVRDTNSAARMSFRGLQWFPVKQTYRVTARYLPYPTPRMIPIANVLGQVQDMASPGYLVFRLGGSELRLNPVEEPGAEELFIIFRDETSGHETYGGGRFLYMPLPEAGAAVLDFNKAYSPPCAFTAFATCPLPPKQNRLPVRIEAGELNPGLH